MGILFYSVAFLYVSHYVHNKTPAELIDACTSHKIRERIMCQTRCSSSWCD